jgi:hypothetical protein
MNSLTPWGLLSCVLKVFSTARGGLGLAYSFFFFLLLGRFFLVTSLAVASFFLVRRFRAGAASSATIVSASAELCFFIRRDLRRATLLGWSAPFWAA